MEYILFLCIILAFIVTFICTPFWIKRARDAKLVGRDIHKTIKEKVAEAGGICVITGFIFGLLTYIAIQTFYFHNQTKSLQIMAVLSTILIIALIGLIDDILGWKIGLRQWQKPLLTLFAALPMVVINAGQSTMAIPLIGRIDVGLLYPLFFIPIAIVGSANGFNMIAGYNGLETKMGIVILFILGFISWAIGNSSAAIIALIMVSALIAFLYFNKYPARVFPGNILTYSVGALIGVIAILGNVERIALILFIPYFIELILKLRGKFQKESFGKLLKDGTLDIPYEKFYGLEHIMIYLVKRIKKKVYENDVVNIILILEIIFIAISFVMWLL